MTETFLVKFRYGKRNEIQWGIVRGIKEFRDYQERDARNFFCV